MKIAHLADIHIRNLKYHDNYRKTFDKLYDSLREKNPDIIVVCGDLAHTKVQISPEYIDLCSDFLDNLQKIQTTIVIPGNHDGVLSNLNRQDSISPIAKNIGGKLLYRRNSDQIDCYPFCFTHLSIFDDNIMKPKDGRINIALYHGAIKGAKTDAGWIIEKGEHEVDIFDGYDFAMLGDIHKSNQILDTEGRVRYCGSLIQQNFGEDREKGYLLWDIQDANTFECEFIPLENECPFVTIEYGDFGVYPKNSMFRVVLTEAITKKEVDDYLMYVSDTFNPKLLTTITQKNFSKTGNNLKINNDDILLETVQEKFLENYVDREVEDERIKERIFELAKKYKQDARDTSSINWTIETVKWSNLFSYKDNNKISFSDKQGITGIFGANYSGKSSVVEIILLGLFNSTSKSIPKSVDYINEDEDYAEVSVTLMSGEDEIEIIRTFTRKNDAAATTVDFFVNNVKFNGQSRTETDKIIQAYLGSKDDFMNTTIATQFGSLEFVESKPTSRRETISRFFGLDVFSEKHKKVSDDYLESKGTVNLLKKKIDEDISVSEIQEEIERKKKYLEAHILTKTNKEKKQSEYALRVAELEAKLKQVPSDVVDVSILEQLVAQYESAEKTIGAELTELEKLSVTVEQKIDKTNRELSDIDYEELLKQKDTLDNYKAKKETALLIKMDFQSKKADIEKAKEIIENPPCHKNNINCCKVIEAKNFLNSQDNLIENEKKSQKLIEAVDLKIKQFNEQEIKILLLEKEKKDRLLSEFISIKNENLKKIENNKFKLDKIIFEKQKSTESLKKGKENISLFKEKEALEHELLSLKRTSSVFESEIKDIDREMANLNKFIGAQEQKIDSLNKMREEYNEKLFDFEALEYLRKAYHNKGIPLMIIKDKIHILNSKIDELLSGIVDFSIYIEDNENIEIMIHHPGQKPRKINLGSGAEKIFASIVIRIALMSVTSLSKAELFILDEPATGLDEEHMSSFMKILDVVKYNYENVILITHLGILKDKVDYVFDVQKSENVSRIL